MSDMTMLDEGHLRFTDDSTRSVAEMRVQGMTTVEIADRLDIALSTVRRRVNRVIAEAERHGYSPANGMVNAQLLPISGTTTLYKPPEDANAPHLLQWVRTSKTAAEMIAEARVIIDAMAQDIPIAEPVSASPLPVRDDLYNLHVLSDLHLGMMAWGRETGGESWNLEAAEKLVNGWVQVSLRDAPPAEKGALVLLGDTWHFDKMVAATSKSGNVLDSSSRIGEIDEAFVRILRNAVHLFLKKYNHVDLIIMAGNHDARGASLARPLLEWVFQNEPRIKVNQSPSEYVCIEHGNTFIGLNHGEKKNVKEIDRVFAMRFPESYGRTKYREVHIGHLHSGESVDKGGFTVRRHRVLIPQEAYSANAGYGFDGSRCAEVITYSARFGLYRITPINPDYVRSQFSF